MSDVDLTPLTDAVLEAVHEMLLLKPGNLGHRYRPIDAESAAIVEAANKDVFSGERPRSLKCWDCSMQNDNAVWDRDADGNEITFATHIHAMYEVMQKLRRADEELQAAKAGATA